VPSFEFEQFAAMASCSPLARAIAMHPPATPCRRADRTGLVIVLDLLLRDGPLGFSFFKDGLGNMVQVPVGGT